MKSQQAMLQAGLRRQQGGTLLGLIIGLVVGLAIAVAVALLITKSSTPFTNKNGNKADMPTSQLLDPNKPLYGNKDAAKEAARDLAKDAKPVDTAETKPVAALERPAPTPAPVAAPAPAPVIAKAPAEAPAAKTDGADDKYVYFLQAGAFREQADAESARAKLALLGFEARISERPSENGNLYRVRIGPFSQVETMNRMRAKLSENSVDVAVVRTAK
ncbi:SPOR domain-containing protein [Undibacterium sp.]|uniref:SPOR domain-containing protein n=1 Tax=Undibacterium sp. TaxID=1914977 RepID=UPI00374CC6B8